MRRHRSLAFRFSLLLATPTLAGTIPDGEAASHAGTFGTVEGIVTGTHVTAKGMEFLDFGGRYPNQDFTVVIFASSAPKIGDISNFYGKQVAVKGKIELYRGHAEIVVNTSDQLRIEP